MNPSAPVFIPGGTAGHPAPPWSSPTVPAPPSFTPPSFSTIIPTILSSTHDSLHSFVMAIILAYQQGIIAGSTISSPPPSLPTTIAASTSSTQSSTTSIASPSIPVTIPPPSTTEITVSPPIHPISSPQNQRYSVRRIPITPSSITNKHTIDITTPPHSPRPISKQSSTITSPLDYSIIINKLPIGLTGFPLIKPSRPSCLLPSTPFRALPPFTIRKERRRNKRNGRRSSRRLSNRQSSTIKSKSNSRNGENNNNNIESPNRFSILASLESDITTTNHQTITDSSLCTSTHSSTSLINDDPTSRPSDLACPPVSVDVITDSSESNDVRLIEAEIEEIVKPLIDGVCMNAAMNARFIDITGGDIHEWIECDSFINHPSRLRPPSPSTISSSTSSSSSSNTTLICHLCSSEVFSCCPECSAPLCYPHFNPADHDDPATNSTPSAHNCAAFTQSVADDADCSQKEKNNDNNNAVQKTQTATKNTKNKSKKKNKSSTNPPPPPSTTNPSPPLPFPPSNIITRRILEDLIEKFNSCYDRIKPRKMKNDLNRTIEKLDKAIDAHYDTLLFADDDDIDNDKYDEIAYNRDIPITLSSNLADALHSLQSHLAPL